MGAAAHLASVRTNMQARVNAGPELGAPVP